MATASQFKFGPFLLIPEEELLLCNQHPVDLPPRCLELLLIFIQHPRRLLTKDFLMEKMWHRKIGEGSLTYTVSLLRKKLGECPPAQRYIQTVSGRGYRFIADVTPLHRNDSGSDVIVEGLAIPTLQPALYQLPAPVPDFVGREKEIETLLGALRNEGRTAIIGINGMGGIGKTQLALLVASRLRDDYPDTQLFVELHGITAKPLEPKDALVDCIRAIKPDIRMPENVEELGRLYRSLLYGLHALIILDNAADSRQVLPLLPPQGCAVIITSRNVLALPGMIRLPLDQLKPDESCELLISIAPHVTQDIGDQICSLCGHLPLAIRAAASLLSVTPDLEPSEYIRELQQERTRIARLKAESMNLDVEASLSISCASLQPEATRVFNELAIFPSTFDANAEEVICEDDGHAYLTDLVQRCLVLYDRTSKRYRLHDLVRLLAKKHLNADEAKKAGRRHAEFYENVLRHANHLFEQGGSAIKDGLAIFDLEWSNIQAGQEWAETWADTNQRAAELCNAYPSAGVNLLSLRLHPREHIDWREAALAAARRLGKRDDEARHWGYLGEAYRRLGDIRKAMDYHQQSLQIAQEMKDRENEGVAFGGIGNVYDNMGEFRLALESYKKARDIAREIKNRRRESGALGNMGIAYWRLGDLQKAIECHEKHLEIAREIGDRLGEGYALGNLGLVYVDLGQPQRTIELNDQALRLFREVGDMRSEGDALGNIGRAYVMLGDIEQAIICFKQEQAIARKIANRELESEALNYLGTAYAALNNENRAIKLYKQALSIARKIGNPRIEADILNDMSLAFKKLGRSVQAIASAEKALKIYEQIENPNAVKVIERLSDWHKQQ